MLYYLLHEDEYIVSLHICFSVPLKNALISNFLCLKFIKEATRDNAPSLALALPRNCSRVSQNLVDYQ